MPVKDFEVIPDTAEYRIRVYGKDLPTIFKNALAGLLHAMHPTAPDCTYTKKDRPHCTDLPITHPVEIRAPKVEFLLIDFLSHALYLSSTYHQAYFKVEFEELTGQHLTATLRGAKVEKVEREIKAVTYHDTKLMQKRGAWQADIVFDT